jgi:hypothetical protein
MDDVRIHTAIFKCSFCVSIAVVPHWTPFRVLHTQDQSDLKSTNISSLLLPLVASISLPMSSA